jgi:hypothetical protein
VPLDGALGQQPSGVVLITASIHILLYSPLLHPMDSNAQMESRLRGEVVDFFSASFFLFIGLIAFAIAAIRRWAGVRILVWIGIWSILFGSNMMAQSAAIRGSLPPWLDYARVLWAVPVRTSP